MIALDEKDALTGNLKDFEKLLPLDLVIKLCKALVHSGINKSLVI